MPLMRKSRASFLFDPSAKVVRYHCHSAFGGPWPPFGDEERVEFVNDLHAVADFAGIELVAFSVGPTAFDLIADVPRVSSLSKKEMLRRFEEVSDPIFVAAEGRKLKAGDAEAWARLRSRFGDLGAFIKSVKQRAAHRYHRHHGTSGAVWCNRYTRAFVQPGHASRVLAAWMDHASLREGLLESPDDDRFSTFGRAVAGDERARAMVARLFLPGEQAPAWRAVAKACRDFAADTTVPPDAPKPHKDKPFLTRPEFLRTEVPHFRGGLALGDRAFVEAVFELNRHEFGRNRASGARRITGQSDPDLWTLRHKGDLRNLRD
jgi:hypothetical protein